MALQARQRHMVQKAQTHADHGSVSSPATARITMDLQHASIAAWQRIRHKDLDKSALMPAHAAAHSSPDCRQRSMQQPAQSIQARWDLALRVLPSSSVWSMPRCEMPVTGGAGMQLVASSLPPRPTSRIATSTRSSRNICSAALAGSHLRPRLVGEGGCGEHGLCGKAGWGASCWHIPCFQPDREQQVLS